MKINVARYRKFIVALVGVAAAIGIAVGDGEVDANEAAVIASSAITALGVFGVRNKRLDEIQSDLDKYGK